MKISRKAAQVTMAVLLPLILIGAVLTIIFAPTIFLLGLIVIACLVAMVFLASMGWEIGEDLWDRYFR